MTSFNSTKPWPIPMRQKTRRQGTGLHLIADGLSQQQRLGEKVMQTRSRLDSLNQAGLTTSLAEILEAPDADAVLSCMGQVQEYYAARCS